MSSGWLDNQIADLARQLKYSPADKRTEQMNAAAELLPQLEAARKYPWEFVLFRITGYRPKEPIEHTISGEVLRSDLARLVEFLSETLDLKVAEAGQPVLPLEDISKQFQVSTKTIQRWRRQGLLAYRFIFPDGRRRLGFLLASVSDFAARNAARLQRSANFRQLSADEKALIIRWARRLAARCRCKMQEIAQRIGRRLRRSPETIRYTIRNYDRENPECAVFPNAADPIRPDDRQVILEYFDRGVSVESIAKRYSRTRSSIYRVVGQQRAARLKALPIEFVPNPLFDYPEADEIILTVLPREALAKAKATVAAGSNEKADDLLVARTPRDLPPYLQEVFRQPVMPQELEIDAFRRMNYLRCKASRLQAKLNSEAATSPELAEIESLIVQANTIKNQLLQSSLRVAVHVARQHMRPSGGGGKGGADVLELVSDANIWLMRAVDRFDFSRGVKFSTYASYALMKNFARDRSERIGKRDEHLVTGQEEILGQIGTLEDVPDQLDALAAQSDLLSVMDELPPRERELIRAHFGLDETHSPMSLAQLGEKLGITKSRVRQIETRALRKLRRLMEEKRRGGTEAKRR